MRTHGQHVRFVNMFIGCLPFAISSWPSWYDTFCSNFILFSWCHICHLNPTLATCCLLLTQYSWDDIMFHHIDLPFVAIIISTYWEGNWLGNVNMEHGIGGQHTIINEEREGKWRNCIQNCSSYKFSYKKSNILTSLGLRQDLFSKNLHEPWPLYAYP